MQLSRKVISAAAALLLLAGTAACSSDADLASANLSADAEAFKIQRRVIFYNGITGEYVLVIEGRCSVDPGDANQMSVTCKAAGDEFKKHYLGKSDNVTWFAEQIEGASVSTEHYKVVFKPSAVIPDIDKK